MLPDQIIRAWKDEEFRHSLSAAEQASLPQNPAGCIELSDEELLGVTGGQDVFEKEPMWTTRTCNWFSIGCCVGMTWNTEEGPMY